MACLSLPKTSLNEEMSSLAKIYDFTKSKFLGKLEEASNMHVISLFLHKFNIKGNWLVNIEFFKYTFKLVIIVF